MEINIDQFYSKGRNLELKERVESLLCDFPIDFVKVIEKARELTLAEASVKPPKYKQRNYMAEIMYGNVIGVLYDNYSEFMATDDVDRPYVALSKNIRVYIKKLTEKYTPNNIKTKNVQSMDAQTLFDEDEDHIDVLYAGFVLNDKDWTLNFKQICISYLNKIFTTKAAWVVGLTEDRFRKAQSIITYLTAATTYDEPLVKLPKKDQGGQAANQ